MTSTEERQRALWAAQIILITLDRELRRVGYSAAMDELLYPLAGWIITERGTLERQGDQMSRTRLNTEVRNGDR